MSEAKSPEVVLPTYWQVAALSELVEVASSITYGVVKPGPEAENGVRFVRGGDVFDGRIIVDQLRTISRQVSESYRRTLLRGGELLMSLVGYPGEVAVVPNSLAHANIARQVALLRIDRRNDATFVMYFLLSGIGKARIFEQSNGSAQQVVNLSDLKNVKINLPPLPQQRKIARILTTLDNVIVHTEALIAKYQSIKQGLMHDLFTRGVDATGKLRPPQSEAPELYKALGGRFIPASWRIASLSEFADVSGGVTLGRDISGTGMISLPYLRVANVQDGYVDLSEIKFVEILKSEIDRYALCFGDVLMTEGGDFDKLGRGTVWKGQIDPCLHQNHVFRVRPLSTELNSDYLSHLTASTYGRNYFLMCAKQTTNLASINATQVKAFPLILPSPEEQDGIVGHIAAIDKMLSAERARIHKARCTKTGLMQDLLTGKVRVNVEVGMENDEVEGGISGRKNAE